MSGVLNLLLAGAASAIKDAYFNLTTLLLNTSSTNGAQNNTFLDSSTNNFTITRNGNTTQGTFTPFSQTGWSTYFSGTSGTRLTYPGSASTYVSGTGDFTIEMWINIDPASAGRSRVLIEGDVSNGIQMRLGPSNTTNINGLSVSRVFNADNEYCNFTFEFNTWYHVAVVRASAVYYFFVNGVQYTTQNVGQTGTYSFATASLVSIGDNNSYPNDEIYKGYISNLRVSSVGRYTSNFTPSTTPLTALSNTQFLSLQDNRWVDRSTNASAISVVGSSGTPSVQAFSPFAPTAAYDTAVVGGSGYFDGTGDYLAVPSSSAFSLTGDFTYEGWVYVTSTSTNRYIMPSTVSMNLDVVVATGNNMKLQFFDGSTATTDAINTFPINTWAHIAFVRSGSGANNCSFYVNGVRGTQFSNNTTNSSPSIDIGRYSAGGNFYGYMGSLRIVNGQAVYSGATYTVPNASLTTTGYGTTSQSITASNTKLLLNYTNAGIYDSASKNVLETVGNAQVSTTQAKWGTTAMYFDGNGDYLSIPNTSLLQLGGSDWTIECWAYISSTTGDQRPISQNNSNYEFAFFMSSGGAMSAASYQSGGSTNFNISMGTLSAGQWYHLAASRSGSTVRAFVNGTLQNSATYSGTIDARTGGWRLGASYVPGDYFNGYLDDVRITLGYARYTATFTPPSAAFPVQ